MKARCSVSYFLTACIVSLTVAAPCLAARNHAPSIEVEVEQYYCRGDFVLIELVASDPDGDRLRYEIDTALGELPNGLVLGSVDGRISGILRRTDGEGSSTGYDVTAVATDRRGLSADVTFNIFSIACEEPRISLFTLVDAKKDTDIRILHDGAVIRRRSIRKGASVRADAYPETADEAFYGGIVESVRFELDGAAVRTENVAPYALGGDRNGNYWKFPLEVGVHELTAIPYDADKAGGNRGLAKIIRFEVIE